MPFDSPLRFELGNAGERSAVAVENDAPTAESGPDVGRLALGPMMVRSDVQLGT